MGGIDEIWTADIASMENNEGFNGILVVLDVFSKYAWARQIVGAKAHDVWLSFQEILEESGRKPKKIWTDEGKEFMGEFAKKLEQEGIEIYQTKTKEKASVAERFIRTLKERIWKFFTARNSDQWIDILQKVVSDYNKSYHRSIKMTPIAASKKVNERKVYANLYPDELLKKSFANFKVGDSVRVVKYKRMGYEKGFTPNWSRRVFIVSEVKPTKPVTYKLENKKKEQLIGSYYNEELLLATQKQFPKIGEKKKKIKRPIKFRDLDSSAVDSDWAI